MFKKIVDKAKKVIEPKKEKIEAPLNVKLHFSCSECGQEFGPENFVIKGLYIKSGVLDLAKRYVTQCETCSKWVCHDCLVPGQNICKVCAGVSVEPSVPSEVPETGIETESVDLPPLPPSQLEATCPKCGQPLKWIAQYERYYCYNCQEYPPI